MHVQRKKEEEEEEEEEGRRKKEEGGRRRTRKKKNKKNKKNKKKRAPDPPGYLRPNSFVPRAPKGTHAGEGSLASEKVSLPILYLKHCKHVYIH